MNPKFFKSIFGGRARITNYSSVLGKVTPKNGESKYL